MRKRPLGLKLFAGAMVVIAISFYVQIMILYNHNIFEFDKIMGKISLANRIVMVLCCINAILASNAQRLILVTAPTLIAAVFWNNHLVSTYGNDYAAGTTLLASFLFLSLHGALLLPSCRTVLFEPGKRWWRQNVRKHIAMPIMITKSDTNYDNSTFDLSSSGAFVPVTGGVFNLKDALDIQLALGTLRKIKCKARVIRIAKTKGTYPSGMGIEFSQMKLKDRFSLMRCIYLA